MTVTTHPPARPFARTGVELAPIALGAMLMGTRTPEDQARRILDDAVDSFAGGAPLMVDTADCYCWWEDPDADGGHSESVLGRWFADRPGVRDRLFLATKGTARVHDRDLLWGRRRADGTTVPEQDWPDAPDWDLARTRYVGAAASTLRESLEGSLRRLGVDTIDLYYVHVDDRSTPLEETLEQLAAFVHEGKVRHLGWSNVRTWRLERIRAICEREGWPQPVAVQQQHSYLRRRAGLEHGSIVDDEQLDYLRERPDLQLVAYSPILKGVFDDPSKRGDHWAMGPYAGPDADARFAAVDEVAAQLGVPGGQVVLAWLLCRTAPTVLPLVGPRTWEQYRSAVAAADVRLDDAQLALLDGAGA
ncbi:MAG: aldo/keto reductase [Kineosporiaceae bacterium]